MLEQSKELHLFIIEIKSKIKDAQLIAFRAVNRELIELYWNIGRAIVDKQTEQGWGNSVVEVIAKELQVEFPGTQGFSSRNIWRMKTFYLTYKDAQVLSEELPQAVAEFRNSKLAELVREIGWSHNIVILEKCKNSLEREYYVRMTRKFGWSRNVLVNNIERKSYERFLTSQTSFDKELPEKYRDQALLAIKDEYCFSFLELEEDHSESELEKGLLKNIRKFLTEMGSYFCFVGSQYRLEIEGDEFFIDLLLYHRKLNCLIAVELKTGKFKPEYAGKMSFYLSALDKTVKLEHENKSIGLIICKDKNRTVVEYTLQDTKKPMGIAIYKSKADLPANIESILPAPEEIARRLQIFDEKL